VLGGEGQAVTYIIGSVPKQIDAQQLAAQLVEQALNPPAPAPGTKANCWVRFALAGPRVMARSWMRRGTRTRQVASRKCRLSAPMMVGNA